MTAPKDPDKNTQGNSPAGSAKGGASGSAKGGLVPPWQRGPGGDAGARPGASSAGAPSAKGPSGPTPQSGPPQNGSVQNGSVQNGAPQNGAPQQGAPQNGVTQSPGANGAAPSKPSNAPAPGPNGTPAAPVGAPQNGAVNGRSGPPPRGVVSGTAAASMGGQQAPVGPADPQGGGTATATEAPAKFVESPTRNIARGSLPTENLPNLDAIHHVEETKATQLPASSQPRSAPVQVGATQPLRAAVQIRRIDPWATFKISAVLAVAGFFIWMISVAVLYLILDGMGVWDQVNSSFGTLVTADGSSSEGDIIGAGTVFGYAILLGAINAILLTALATVGAYIYNLCADLIGGAEITLADLD